MRVAVTGAGGFIGRHVVRDLLAHGYDVVPVVRPEGRLSLAEVPAVLVDLREPRGLVAVDPPPQVVVHMAASLPAGFQAHGEEQAADTNRRIDDNVIEACMGWRSACVYGSSTSVYGLSYGDVNDESRAPNPSGPYAAAKVAGEAALAELGRAGLVAAALRISAPYAPDQSTRTVLRLFVERALAGEDLRFHGTGSRAQDFTHVDDVASFVRAVLAKGAGGVYNVASGAPITMRDLASLVVSCVPGCRSRVVPSGQPDPQEGVTAIYPIGKALRDLGWRPEVDLMTGVRRLVAALAPVEPK